jgi:hypothetical protein
MKRIPTKDSISRKSVDAQSIPSISNFGGSAYGYDESAR